MGQKPPVGKVPLILPYEQMRIVAGPIVIGVSQFNAQENSNIIGNIRIYSLTG